MSTNCAPLQVDILLCTFWRNWWWIVSERLLLNTQVIRHLQCTIAFKS
jgi:proteasome lid subunit RPN8/RPN11